LRSFPGPNEWTAPVKEKVVEKIVEKEVIKEVPVEKVVEKIVYQETPITESTFRAKLGDFLRKVGPKGRAMQHERALEKRRAALALFDIHERVTSSLLEESLHLKHSDADRILSDLVKEGKIVLHAPKVEHVTPGKRPHHGGRGSYYTRA
jgi:predicted HTH transcriptional regulator